MPGVTPTKLLRGWRKALSSPAGDARRSALSLELGLFSAADRESNPVVVELPPPAPAPKIRFFREGLPAEKFRI